MESEKLLPCPFCNGEGLGVTSVRDGYEVWCRCGAQMTAHNPNGRAKAIAAWNTRAPADLRSALEAETIERKALHEILRVRPPGDVETCKVPRKLVEQMERIAMAALAPTKEPAAGTVLMPARATREMIDAADACTDAYEAYGKMVEVGRVR